MMQKMRGQQETAADGKKRNGAAMGNISKFIRRGLQRSFRNFRIGANFPSVWSNYMSRGTLVRHARGFVQRRHDDEKVSFTPESIRRSDGGRGVRAQSGTEFALAIQSSAVNMRRSFAHEFHYH
jgi:hypothetical protein